jgi:hypothetical protein
MRIGLEMHIEAVRFSKITTAFLTGAICRTTQTVDKYVLLKDSCPCERHAENSIAFFCEEP